MKLIVGLSVKIWSVRLFRIHELQNLRTKMDVFKEAEWIDPELPHGKDERQPASVLRRSFTVPQAEETERNGSTCSTVSLSLGA